MPILRDERHPYTFEKLKRGVGAFLSECGGSGFCLQIVTAEQSRVWGGWDSSPSLPAVLSPLSQQIFGAFSLGKMPRSKGNAEGSKKEQDKGRGSQVAPARITTPRSAGRFKGFDVSDSGGQRWSVGITSDITGGRVSPQIRMAQ